MSLSAIKDELLRSLFPLLLPENDPDIERYFELRGAGRPGDALALYASRLKPRYMDDDFRSHLLRAYRTRAPVYRQLLLKAYGDLGDRLLEQTKQKIKFIAAKTRNFDPTDAYSTIKAAEAILVFLPREQFSAIATIERYHRYAEAMKYHVVDIAVAENLVRAYLTDTLTIVMTERQRQQRRLQLAENNRRKALVKQDRLALEQAVQSKRNSERAAKDDERRKEIDRNRNHEPIDFFDFSKIRFSASDLARIQIPPTLTKLEDRTLAYCFKYWNLVNDSAFERVIFLFSKLNKSRHYEVFLTIKIGRRSGRSDEEILTLVLSAQTTGYYYSIRGDAYLRSSWFALRKKLEKVIPAVKKGAQSAVVPRRRQVMTEAYGLPMPQSLEIKTQSFPPTADMKIASETVAVDPELLILSAATGQTLEAARNVAIVVPVKTENHIQDAKTPIKNLTRSIKTQTGSVADKLRVLSGRSYDVYKDRFFGKVRVAIRRVLADNRDGHHSLFTSIPQEAEECVFNFLLAHYEDPFMDWERSRERVRLNGLGFPLSSLDSVIKDCYARL